MPTESTIDILSCSIVLEAYEQAMEDLQFEEARILLEELRECSDKTDSLRLRDLKIE
jgi:hypothetical protein